MLIFMLFYLASSVLSSDVYLVDIMKRANCLIRLFIVLRTGERFLKLYAYNTCHQNQWHC